MVSRMRVRGGAPIIHKGRSIQSMEALKSKKKGQP